MGLSLDEIQIEEDLYHASADEILEIIEEQEDELDGLMLFGHNPGMTDLVNILSDLDLYNLPTAGVVVLQYEVETWKEISQMDPDQVMIDFPKNHR
jgi:phosphohistidine phosphatase